MSPTRWSLVRRASAGGDDLEEWISTYWYPLFIWARHQGWKAHDAADEVQAFMAKLCAGNLLAMADPARGRLRNWLLKAFRNHLGHARESSQSLKRGGGCLHLSIDLATAEAIYQNDEANIPDAETAYHRAWALTLMEEALDRLCRDHEQAGKRALFDALLPALEEPFRGDTYANVAAKLGMSSAALRQASVRFRQRYRRILLDLAGERLGISDEAKLEAELRDLLGS
jgi:RNA polymerase sigma-70 factor (ECF subfamily)